MPFTLLFTEEAAGNLDFLEQAPDKAKKLKAVQNDNDISQQRFFTFIF